MVRVRVRFRDEKVAPGEGRRWLVGVDGDSEGVGVAAGKAEGLFAVLKGGGEWKNGDSLEGFDFGD